MTPEQMQKCKSAFIRAYAPKMNGKTGIRIGITRLMFPFAWAAWQKEWIRWECSK